MPRLTDDQIRAGLFHDDIDVRTAVLRYFADCYPPDPTIMPAVIEALERFGRTKAFRYRNRMDQLRQSETTLRWAIEELKARRPGEEWEYVNTLSSLICKADPRLLPPLEADLLSTPAFSLEYRGMLTDRLKLLTWDSETLWRELEAICAEFANPDFSGEGRWSEAENIVEALGRQGDQHEGRMMDFLPRKIEENENDPQKWMESYMVRLAGELRHAPAIPFLVAKLHEDAEGLSEVCAEALGKIGGDEVIRAVHHDYPMAKYYFRLFASGVFDAIHTDLAVQTLIELLSGEEEAELPEFLTRSLVGQFSTEGNEVVHRFLLDNLDLSDLRDSLVTACTLMGQDFPELEQWRKDAEEERRGRATRYSEFSRPFAETYYPPEPPPPLRERLVPIERVKKKVGRNDPCPCGSGKKFKKCCMDKKGFI